MSSRLAGLALAATLLGGGCALVVRPEEPAAEAPRADEQARPSVSVAPIDSAHIAPGVDTPYWRLIRAGGPLVVGINSDYPPFGVRARTPEGWAGFDVDLAQHLGATLGVPVVIRGVRSQEAMARLSDGSIDVAIAGLTRTVYRSGQINFSAPYLTVSQAALVPRAFVEGSRGTDEERRRLSFTSYYDLARLPGLRIGAVRFTRPARLAESAFPQAELRVYESIEQVSQALIKGEVDALVHDDPYVRVWGALHPAQARQFVPLLDKVTAEPIAMAIRKGDLEFLHFLDAYVDEASHDGTLERLYRRHFVDAAWLSDADLGGAR